MDANITVNKQRRDAVLFIQMETVLEKGRDLVDPTLMVEKRTKEREINIKITEMFQAMETVKV